jgi:hypothetical protein
LYPLQQWKDYIRINSGIDYNQLLAQYEADRILLNLELQPDLARALEDDPVWVKEYSDERAQIWYKIGSR